MRRYECDAMAVEALRCYPDAVNHKAIGHIACFLGNMFLENGTHRSTPVLESWGRVGLVVDILRRYRDFPTIQLEVYNATSWELYFIPNERNYFSFAPPVYE